MGDLLKKEGMVDIEALEMFGAKKRDPGSRTCNTKLLERRDKSQREDGVPFRFREMSDREYIFNALHE